MIKIVVAGAKGRMGSLIVKLVNEAKDLELAAGIDKGDSLEKSLDMADVVIDFTLPLAAASNASIAAKYKKPIIIGTTGLNDKQKDIVREAARIVPIVFAPNMSIGVNVMWKLVEVAAKTLGKNFRADIEETHHVHKLDKPSGTAKKILEIVQRENGEIKTSIESIRKGEVVGDHIIRFTTSGETLAIEHHAETREIFAKCAIAAARWIVGKPAGLYGMDDVLNLK